MACTYLYGIANDKLHGCNSGGVMGIHQRRTHATFVDGCWACKASTVQLTPSAAPTSADSSLAKMKAEEKTLTEDGEAYKRLRRDGFQPKNINGSAQLEAQAQTRYEIESAQLFTGPAQQGMRDAVTWFEDHAERSVFEPATTPRGDDAA